MARPQKNNADYFTHDNSMRNDKKLKAVRSKFGTEGYGVYCMLLEVLTEADLLYIQWNMLEIEMLAGDFGIDSEMLKEIVDYFDKINLVQLITNKEENQFLICRQLDRRLKQVFDKRKDAFEKWANKYYPERLSELENYDFEGLRIRNGVSDAETQVSDTENRQSKVKKSTVQKSKGKYTLSDSKNPNPNACAPNGVYSEDFEKFWKDLPSQMKVGKKEAFEVYKSTVHSNIDFENLLTAIDKYKNSDRFQRGIIQNGSNWLKNWTDWIDYDEPKKETKDERRKREMDEAFNRVFKDEETAKENKNEFF